MKGYLNVWEALESTPEKAYQKHIRALVFLPSVVEQQRQIINGFSRSPLFTYIQLHNRLASERPMPVVFCGVTRKQLRDLSPVARYSAGFQLEHLQHGLPPYDAPLGRHVNGTRSVRVWDRPIPPGALFPTSEDEIVLHGELYLTIGKEAIYLLYYARNPAVGNCETATRAISLAREQLKWLAQDMPDRLQ